MSKKQKIAVALTGASGSIYAKVLFGKLLQLQDQIEDVGVVMSENAKFVWQITKKMNCFWLFLQLFAQI